MLPTTFRRFGTALLVLVLAFSVVLVQPFMSGASAATADVAGIATKPSNDGYWTTNPEGLVNAHGTARFLGDLRSLTLNQPITGMASTPTGEGYWLVASDGGIFAFGDARFYGSTGSLKLNQPVVGMASTPTGNGYWLVAFDGGIFAFGDARFYGSTGALKLNKPITGMTSSPEGKGYWLVASDGGIFAFGDARFYGSTGSLKLNQPVVGMASTPTGNGYWLVASDGGIFAFGDAPFRGAGEKAGSSVFGMTPDGRGGYSLLRSDGAVLKRLAPVDSPAPVSVPTTSAPTTTTVAPVPSTTTTTTPRSTTTTTVVPRTPTTTSTTTTTAAPVTTTTIPRTTTTTSATAPPTTSTTAPPTPSSGNPFSSRALWVDPSNPAISQANTWRSSRPGDAAYMDRMGSTSSAMWIGEWSGDVRSTIDSVTTNAANANQLPVFIAYNIPGRDCGSYSAGGAARASDYKAWIRNFAAGIGNKPAVVVLEPDALSQLDCLDNATKQSRIELLNDAVDVLEAKPNASVYLDAGHPGWHSADEMASRLSSAGVNRARGFSLNVSNFTSTSENLNYGVEVSNRLGGSHFVVDTSRNGNGSNGEWCNPLGRAVGQEPTTNTGRSQADALLWLKRPGESDGTCNGGPSAGSWWADYAIGLARSAWG